MDTTKSSQIEKNQQVETLALGRVQSLEIIYLETPDCKFQDLFDYDNETPKARKLILKDSAVVAVTKDDKFCFLQNQFEKDQKTKPMLGKIKQILCSFTQLDNYYLLKPLNNSLAKTVWVDIGSFSSKLFPIRKNDIIRLGSKVMTVRQVRAHDQSIPPEFTQQQIFPSKQTTKNLQTPNQIPKNNSQSQIDLCRMCQLKAQDSNPLITVCKCQVNQKYAHFLCLQKYFQSHLKIKVSNFGSTIEWRSLTCEKCQSKLNDNFKIDQKNFNIFTIPRPNPPYIIFQHQSPNGNQQKQNYLEVIQVPINGTLCIGTSSKSQICLPKQPSVEGVHCQLVYDSGSRRFLLADLSSTFGTLIKVQQSLKVRPHHKNLKVQVGNVVLDMTAQRIQAKQRFPNFQQSNKLFQDQINESLKEDSHFFI